MQAVRSSIHWTILAEPRFADDQLQAQYRADRRLCQIVGLFSGLAIFVARLGTLVAAGAVALAIALVTVSTQTVRAARIDPAEALRSE